MALENATQSAGETAGESDAADNDVIDITVDIAEAAPGVEAMLGVAYEVDGVLFGQLFEAKPVEAETPAADLSMQIDGNAELCSVAPFILDAETAAALPQNEPFEFAADQDDLSSGADERPYVEMVIFESEPDESGARTDAAGVVDFGDVVLTGVRIDDALDQPGCGGPTLLKGSGGGRNSDRLVIKENEAVRPTPASELMPSVEGGDQGSRGAPDPVESVAALTQSEILQLLENNSDDDGASAVSTGLDVTPPPPPPPSQTLIGDGRQNGLIGGDGDDFIDGLGNNDAIDGAGGDDIIFGGGGRDLIFGGDGDDIIEAGGSPDEVFGQDGDDIIFGGGGADIIDGGDGDDIIDGGKASDTIYGGDGNDQINGGRGSHDIIEGGAGDDILTRGGGRNDTLVFKGAFGNDTLTDFDNGFSQVVLDFQGASNDQFTLTETSDGVLITIAETPGSDIHGSLTILNATLSDVQDLL